MSIIRLITYLTFLNPFLRCLPKPSRPTASHLELTVRQIAADDEYFLKTVTVFKKTRDEFVHKCRENK